MCASLNRGLEIHHFIVEMVTGSHSNSFDIAPDTRLIVHRKASMSSGTRDRHVCVYDGFVHRTELEQEQGEPPKLNELKHPPKKNKGLLSHILSSTPHGTLPCSSACQHVSACLSFQQWSCPMDPHIPSQIGPSWHLQ